MAVAAAVVAYAVAAVVGPEPGAPPTTYGGAWVVARAADVAAGLALLTAGLLAFTERRRVRIGALAVLAGVLWFGPDWEGWARGPSLVVSLGALTPPLLLAVVFHLTLSLPTGRPQGRIERIAVAALYATAAALSIGRALVRDPFLDPHCWRNCLDNSFLVHPDPGLAGAFDDAAAYVGVAAGLALTVLSIRRAVGAARAQRPALSAGALVGAA